MSKKITIPIQHEQPPASWRFYDIYTVDKSKVILKEIELIFQPGAFRKLYAAFYYGDMKVAPEVGMYTGDGGKIVDHPDVVYYSGDKIRLKLVNYDTSNSYYIWGSVELEVEEE